ncbi:MAG: FAD-dependent oxidoreductase [Halothiobacillus sp. 28-55-5]|nr:MAG: FAD-dependent oxidoreductase [Halothiobacillus sp. 28-55-5]
MSSTTELKLTQNSYYAASANEQPAYPRLEGDTEADVCVVGGGFAGLSAAIELADRGYSVVVLEAKTIGWGASGRNGGQIIAGLACEHSVIEKALGLDAAKQVWGMTLEALDLVHERVKRFNIQCDLRPGFLGVAVNARKGAALRQWFDDMAKKYQYDTDTQWIEPAHIKQWIDSPRFHSGYHDRRSGHLHPLNYTLGLARGAQGLGVQIFEHSPVQAMSKGEPAQLQTGHGSVKARFVVLAGNMYLPEVSPGLAPALAKRIMPVGTYIVATEPLDPTLTAELIPTRSAVCDSNFVLDYFRFSADNRMLFGGRVSYSTMTPPNLKEDMHKRMKRVFPQLASAKVAYSWGGFVDITMNRAPDFGRVAPNVYYLQGFSGHGVALTGMAGKMVAEAIAGQAERLDLMARIPHHDFPGGRVLRTPALVLGMAWYRLRDALG